MGRCGEILILQPPKTSLLRKVLVAWWRVDPCGPRIRPTGRQTPHHRTTVEVLRRLSWQEELLISFSVSPFFFVFFCYWIFHNQFNSSHLISILVCGIKWHQTVSQFLSSNLENNRCLLLFSRSVVSDSLQPHESQHARPPCPYIYTHIYTHIYIKWKWTSLSCVGLFVTTWNTPWNSPSQNTREDSHSVLQGIFPTQGLNPGLLHCRQTLYQLSHQGSPYIYEPPIF